MTKENNVVVKIEQVTKTRTRAVDAQGTDYSHEMPSYKRKQMLADTGYAVRKVGSTGRVFWRSASQSDFASTAPIETTSGNVSEDHAEIVNAIHSSYSLKPNSLIMNEIKWKYLVRSAMRGKNIMMTGPAGCGKTMAAKSLVKSLDRPEFYFNMGSTQDPRATLIGNTHFDKSTGTYFSEALFVKAIQTENAVILLDELSRAHPDAWNILMTVLDEGQRYLRLDEADGQATIKVARGVTFIATANIGNEYTSTRVMDRALVDRFTQIEMDVLNQEEESALLGMLYPNVKEELVHNVAEFAWVTRMEAANEEGKLSTHISTRSTVEIAGLIYDGFSMNEAAEVAVLPKFDNAGGIESERTFVKQLLQKYTADGSSDELFTDAEESAEGEI
jgi:MoxR-like ATPase|tara:strand:+ start:582 stop:1748 length:1167 start_codon:yes stop_codon:yes gene_type:complete